MANKVLRTLWLRRNMVLGVLLLSYVFAGLCFSFFPVEYRATASVNFYPFVYQVNNLESVTKESQPDPNMFEDENTLILSPTVLNMQIEKWKLKDRPEYNPAVKDQKILTVFWEKLWKNFTVEENLPLEEHIKQKILENTHITPIHYSQIDITVSSSSPWVARSMVNSITEEYLKTESVHGEKTIKSFAELPETPEFWRLKEFMVQATFIGLLLGMFCAGFLRLNS